MNDLQGRPLQTCTSWAPFPRLKCLPYLCWFIDEKADSESLPPAVAGILFPAYFPSYSSCSYTFWIASSCQFPKRFPLSCMEPVKSFELVQECLPLTSSLPRKEFNFLRICVCDSRYKQVSSLGI